MKKILNILLVLFLFLSCYLIYKLTDKKEISYVSIGNYSILDEDIIDESNVIYSDTYVNVDYRIMDLVNIIKYNEEKDISIHYLLKNADILIISVGINELYNKLNSDTKNIYQYINDMVNDMDNLLIEISKYEYDKVYVLGYYNIGRNNNDIFTYINYKMKKLVEEYNYVFIDLNKIIEKNDLIREDNYKLNSQGIEKINKKILAYN